MTTTTVSNLASQRNNRPFDPSNPNPTTTTPSVATNATAAPVQGMDSSPTTAGTISASSQTATQSAIDASAPQPAGTQISDETAFSAIQQVMSITNAIANPLTLYNGAGLNNYTYHFRLSMTREQDLFAGSDAADLSGIYTRFDQLDKVVLAESGVTAGFSIQDVEIESNIAPGNSRNVSLYALKITIVDALGSSFMEAVRQVANQYQISNSSKFFAIYLELTFRGYDANGNLLPNILQNVGYSGGNGRWLWQLTTTDIDVRMDESGTTHTLTCVPTQITAFSDHNVAVPESITISGNTIKEMLDDLGTKVTDAYSKLYLGPIYTYKFVNKGIQGSTANADNFKIVVTDQDNSRGVTLSEQGKSKTPTAQIARGTLLADVVDYLFMHSPDAQKIILDVKSPDTLIDPDGTFNGKQSRQSVYFNAVPDVLVTGYDPVTETYIHTTTYNIWGYLTYRPVLHPTQVENAQSPTTVAQLVQTLRDKNFMNKHYEYIYTGLNTEVVNCDIKFNTVYFVPLPQLLGWRGSYDAVAYHGLASDSAKNPTGTADANNFLKMRDDQLQSQLTQLNSELSSLETQDQSNATVQAAIAQNNSTRTKLQQAANIRRVYYKSATADNLTLNSQVSYAEDVAAQNVNKKYDQPLRFSFQQSGDQARNAAGGAMLSQSDPGSMNAGSAYDQLYADPTNAMVSLELEIRGDPYWLGYSSFDQRAVNNGVPGSQQILTNNMLPNTLQGDVYYSLRFRFPYMVNDTDGSLIFRDDDIFSGAYYVTTVRSTFSGGEFRQTLTSTKQSLINMIVARNSTQQSGTSAAPAAPSSSATTPSNPPAATGA